MLWLTHIAGDLDSGRSDAAGGKRNGPSNPRYTQGTTLSLATVIRMFMFAVYGSFPFWLAYRLLWLFVGRRRAALGVLSVSMFIVLLAIGMVLSGLLSFLYEPHSWWTSIHLDSVIMDWFWGLGDHWADRRDAPFWPMFFVGYVAIAQFMYWYVAVLITHFNLAMLFCNAAMIRLFFLLRSLVHSIV